MIGCPNWRSDLQDNVLPQCSTRLCVCRPSVIYIIICQGTDQIPVESQIQPGEMKILISPGQPVLETNSNI